MALRKSFTIEEVDAPRIRKGFEKLFPTVTEWPAVKQLLNVTPSRPPRVSLPEPKPTEEHYEKGLQEARKLSESYRK